MKSAPVTTASRFSLLLVTTAALGLGCGEPAPGSTEPLAPNRSPARASAQAPEPWASAFLPPLSAPPDPAAAAARAARQQAQVNGFAQRSGRGGLLLRVGDQDALVPGPVLSSDVEINVTGPIARVIVRQRFQNPSREWVEGIYIFPLPGDAAVDHMRVVTGRATLEGEIQEKKKAQKAYVEARAQGKQAGLVEWQRPNLFSTAVANIEPGGEVLVEIEYQQSLAPDSGAWSLRFPLATRRPGDPQTPSSQPGSPAPDPASLTGSPLRFPVSIVVDLAPGFAVHEPTSPYHDIRATPHAEGYAVEFAEGEIEADRDFVLRWQALAGDDPQAALFQESWAGRHQALLILEPPHPDGPPPAGLAREIIFVVDTSGSMAGTSIRQARRALRAGIEQLAHGDRFNVLAFSGTTRGLFEAATPTTAAARRQAFEFIEGLEARGATEMVPALDRALRVGGAGRGHVRQVVVITDGAVPSPAALHARIQRQVGESRLFMVGIGSAPNGHFMRKAAGYGRGTYTAIGDPAEAAAMMMKLFGKLGSVVLSEIELELPSGVAAEVHPSRVGDLYRGEPLVVMIESDQPLAWVGVRGRAGEVPWRMTVDGRDGEVRPGVHVLWGRRKIEALLDSIRAEGDPGDKKAAAITALALSHHLVSPYTSLVAVEKVPRRRDHEGWVQKLVRGPVASASAPALKIRFGQGATPAALQLVAGVSGLAAAWAIARARRRLS